MTMILEAKMISKHYGQLIAVDEISFSDQQGEIFSLLGPNGAGKTTTISMLSGLLRPSDGDAFIAGHSIRQETVDVKKVIGVVPQEIALFDCAGSGWVRGAPGNLLQYP